MNISLAVAMPGEAYLNFLGAREIDDDEDKIILNAFSAETLVGSIKYDLGTTNGSVFVHQVYVAEAFRGLGIMRQLVAYMLDDAWYTGTDTLDGDFSDPRLRSWMVEQPARRFDICSS